MLTGTFEPFIEEVHVLKNETSTRFFSSAITEKFVPSILHNRYIHLSHSAAKAGIKLFPTLLSVRYK